MGDAEFEDTILAACDSGYLLDTLVCAVERTMFFHMLKRDHVEGSKLSAGSHLVLKCGTRIRCQKKRNGYR